MERINPAIRDQVDFLNKCSQVIFRSNYWNLSDRQRSAVHLAINDKDTSEYGRLSQAGVFQGGIPGIHNGQYGGYPSRQAL